MMLVGFGTMNRLERGFGHDGAAASRADSASSIFESADFLYFAVGAAVGRMAAQGTTPEPSLTQ